MQRWRKMLSAALMSVAFFAFTPSSVQADSCDPCCDPCGDVCGFDLGVEFLWWKACADDFDYAAVLEEGSSSTIHYKSVCPDWNPGVRVTIGKSDFNCDLGVRASYTYYQPDGSASTPLAENLGSNVPLFDKASASWDTKYHEWDLLMTYEFSCNECHRIVSSFGAAGIYFDQEFTATLSEESKKNEIKWDADYWGVGLRSGFDYYHRLNDCMVLTSSVNGTILTGEPCAKLVQKAYTSDTLDKEVTIKDDDCCQFVPGYQIAVGLNYDMNFCDCETTLTIGYEFVQWHNLPNHRSFSDDDTTTGNKSYRSHTTLGFHGLTVGARMEF